MRAQKWLTISLVFVLLLVIICPSAAAPPLQEPGSPEAPPPTLPPAVAPASSVRSSAIGDPPAYDSGWVSPTKGDWTALAHNLGGDTDDYVVDIQAKGLGQVNQRFLGSVWYYDRSAGETQYTGSYWAALTSTHIQVYRFVDDVDAEEVRVRIWVVPEADYDSGWTAIDPGQTKTFSHNLGGDPDEYVVDLQFSDSDGAWGIHNRMYGLQTYHQGGTTLQELGAAWQALTGTSIQVHRGAHDDKADQVRVRIWRKTDADYDSGWQNAGTAGNVLLFHNLGGPWNDLVVDLQFKSSDPTYGVHQTYYGSDRMEPASGVEIEMGAYWYELAGGMVRVDRGADDTLVEQVRVRVWATSKPKYDSGWTSIGVGEEKTFTHNLGGNSDAYVVDLQFKDTDQGAGVNQWNYGGDHYWDPDASTMRKYGTCWTHLTNTDIRVKRFVTGGQADQVRVRIWVAPQADYDSGWFPLDAGANHTFVHNLDGSTDDYVVDLQFRDLSAFGLGVHHYYYGGNRYYDDSDQQINYGVYWRNLAYNSIQVKRMADDVWAPEVRVRIWRNPQPDFRGAWVDFEQNEALSFYHGLGGSTDDYVVDLHFFDSDGSGIGINQFRYGTDDYYTLIPTFSQYGACWRKLTDQLIEVFREGGDWNADYIRARIWVVDSDSLIYLPLVIRQD